MTPSEITEKQIPKVISIEDEIAKATEKLRKLQEKQKEMQKRERERCQKAVFDFIKTEKLDGISVDLWTAALPDIKRLLGVEKLKSTAHAATPSLEAA
jgi:phosphopantothenate synthetase